jgi:hypothetical protein
VVVSHVRLARVDGGLRALRSVTRSAPWWWHRGFALG